MSATNVPTDQAVLTATDGASATIPLPWRTLIREAAWLWLVWQIVLIAFTYTALTFAIANSFRTTPAYVVTPASFYQTWVRHDSDWYLQIAANGYGAPGTLAFFPLYPALIHLVTILCLGNAPLAAVLVARLADFGVCLGVLALAWQELGASIDALVAWRSPSPSPSRWPSSSPRLTPNRSSSPKSASPCSSCAAKPGASPPSSPSSPRSPIRVASS